MPSGRLCAARVRFRQRAQSAAFPGFLACSRISETHPQNFLKSGNHGSPALFGGVCRQGGQGTYDGIQQLRVRLLPGGRTALSRRGSVLSMNDQRGEADVSQGRHAFDAAVVLHIGDERLFLDNVEDARRCLEQMFPDATGASYQRALAACEACLANIGTAAAARIMMVVAAMEAGFRFEVIEDPEQALELKTEIEAEAGLRAVLFDAES